MSGFAAHALSGYTASSAGVGRCLLDAQGSIGGGVDGLVAVVPPNAHSRARLGADHFLDDTSPRSSLGRLRLRADSVTDLELHDRPPRSWSPGWRPLPGLHDDVGDGTLPLDRRGH